MKRSYAAIAAFLMLACVSFIRADGYRQVWMVDDHANQVADPGDINVNAGGWNAICRSDETTLWVVGDSGRVRKFTVEEGPHQEPVLEFSDEEEFGHDYTLTDVCFPDASHGYIVGYVNDHLVHSANKWKGKIWRYTPSTGWLPVYLGDLDIFSTPGINVPCLSVDFFNDQKGYVGCGWGYVLRTDDGGQTWEKTPKRPSEGVVNKIGAIPRGYSVEYLNGWGDWYWDIKIDPNNSNHVYAASDNNGVFYETADAGESEWAPHCFGQDESYNVIGNNVPDVDYAYPTFNVEVQH